MEQSSANDCHLILNKIRRAAVEDGQAEERRGDVRFHLLFLKENPRKWTA
jgi:hypothetical protein